MLRRVLARLLALVRRNATAAEIREEMQFHMDMREEEYCGKGLDPNEARRAASRRFGSLALMADRGYDIRGAGLLETLIQDVRYACRLLLAQRGFALVAILTVALAIGVSTALFSVLDATVIRPLPYPRPEQLVRVVPEVVMPDGRVMGLSSSMADMRLWQSARDVFTAVAGWGRSFGGRIVDGPEPERIQVMQFTEEYLSMHGVQPLMGRDFIRDDMDPGAPLVALLGYGYWQSRYGGRTDVLGDTIRLDDGIATIVGVLPATFDADVPVARPLRIPPEEVPRRGTGRVSVYGRLRPGVTIEQARERLAALMVGDPGAEPVAGVIVTSRLENEVARSRTTANVMAGAVGLILLIACVNVSSLLLARGTARQTELAVRASLGAGRGRLVRQLLTESAVIAAAGGVLGVLLAWTSLGAIVAILPISVPQNSTVALNLGVLAAAAGLIVPTSLLFGLAPAIRLSRAQIGSALARGGRQAGSALTRRAGQALIAAEVALAVVLVTGAGLMIRSFARLTTVDLGFNPEGLVTLEVLPIDRDPAVHRTYFPLLLERIRAIPGVGSAGLVDRFVLGDSTSFTNVTMEDESAFATVFDVLPGYFETIGARLRDGRLPLDSDSATGFRGAVMSESAARALGGNRPVVGRQLTRGMQQQSEPWTVLGVIADLGHGGPLGRDRGTPQVFFLYDANPARLAGLAVPMVVVVRPAAPIPGLADQLREAAQSVGPRVLVERVRAGEDWFDDRVLTPRRRTLLLGLLGGLGLALSIAGIFGVTAYAVARRATEVGVRMAFGAQPRDVVLLMVQDAARPVLLGLGAGLVAAYNATRVVESFLFETAPRDPATFTLVALLTAFTAILAAWLPARRAARVDPAVALRAE